LPLIGERSSPIKFLLVAILVNKGGLCPPSEVKNVKGLALKTHQRLCLWNPQAFEKACAKLLAVLG